MIKASPRFRVVQPYGRDTVVQSTEISDHATMDEAFAAIDAYAVRCAEQGLPGDYKELRVIDMSMGARCGGLAPSRGVFRPERMDLQHLRDHLDLYPFSAD